VNTSTDDEVYLGRVFSDNLPVHLQRFGRTREATAAVEETLVANMFQQGVGRIQEDDADARKWSQIYYTRGEATFHAYLLEFGQAVVTATPAEMEWGPGGLAGSARRLLARRPVAARYLTGRQNSRSPTKFNPLDTYTDGMHDLTGFQRDLLYNIAGLDEPHGLAIKDELETYYEKEIHHGRLYPNLDTLVEKGLVDKGQRDRRTNFYTLTRRGQRELAARREWEDQYLEDSNSIPA
jgi:DNA-binding PadR family transcriptional regulator